MQEMTVYQSYQTPKMLLSLTAGAGLAMASGKNSYTLCLLQINFFSSDVYCVQFLIFCSVGSLGKSLETAMVEQITVSNCSFVGTMTGVRIKSWQVMETEVELSSNEIALHTPCIYVLCKL